MGLFIEGTKTAKAFEHLKNIGSLTIRDLCSPPYYSNGANKIIQRIKKRLEEVDSDVRLTDEWVTENGSRFKRFYLQDNT